MFIKFTPVAFGHKWKIESKYEQKTELFIVYLISLSLTGEFKGFPPPWSISSELLGYINPDDTGL